MYFFIDISVFPIFVFIKTFIYIATPYSFKTEWFLVEIKSFGGFPLINRITFDWKEYLNKYLVSSYGMGGLNSVDANSTLNPNKKRKMFFLLYLDLETSVQIIT